MKRSFCGACPERLGNFLLFRVALQTEQAENVVEPTDRRG